MSLSPDQLKTLRDRLLRLHKTLLDSDRAAYERAYGPVGSSGEWLQLVLGHEHFAWLRPFSGLIVRIDEWLAGDERLPDELTAFLKEVDRLTLISGNDPNLRAIVFLPAPDTDTDRQLRRLVADCRASDE